MRVGPARRRRPPEDGEPRGGRRLCRGRGEPRAPVAVRRGEAEVRAAKRRASTRRCPRRPAQGPRSTDSAARRRRPSHAPRRTRTTPMPPPQPRPVPRRHRTGLPRRRQPGSANVNAAPRPLAIHATSAPCSTSPAPRVSTTATAGTGTARRPAVAEDHDRIGPVGLRHDVRAQRPHGPQHPHPAAATPPRRIPRRPRPADPAGDPATGSRRRPATDPAGRRLQPRAR